MTFKEWILSDMKAGNPSVAGQWKLPHIATLISCIGIILLLGLLFRNKSEKSRKIIIYTLAGLLIFFETTRRIINLIKMTEFNWHDFLYTMLPRPWCAISVFSIIFSTFMKSKNFKNFASIISLLCAIIFFAYPEAGFITKYVLFEQLYSIATHSLLLLTSILNIMFRFTNFDFKTIWKEGIYLAVVYVYAFIEIYLLKIASDPLYFMPNNDVQDVLGINYGMYMVVYVLFLMLFMTSFYLVTYLYNRKRLKQKDTF